MGQRVATGSSKVHTSPPPTSIESTGTPRLNTIPDKSKRFYVSVNTKFRLALAFTVIWVSVSVWISAGWVSCTVHEQRRCLGDRRPHRLPAGRDRGVPDRIPHARQAASPTGLVANDATDRHRRCAQRATGHRRDDRSDLPYGLRGAGLHHPGGQRVDGPHL